MSIDWTLATVLLYLLIGLAAGVVAGFVGVGGGVVMVPVLLEIYRRWGLPEDGLVQAAMATSLTVAVGAVTSSVVGHARRGRVAWPLVPMLVPGSLAGGVTAARLAAVTPGIWLQLILALLMSGAALRLMFDRPPPDHVEVRPRPLTSLFLGFGVGLVAGLSGLAGGVVLVPALALIAKLPSRYLAGTSSATIVFSALAAAVGYLTATPPTPLPPAFTGYSCLPLAACLAVAAVPGAQLGAWLNRRVGSLLFRRLFAVMLLLVVARLLLRLVA